MIYFVCKCPKCGSEFEPDIEKTFEYYESIYKLGTQPIQLLNEEPPFKPDEFIMVCENPECGNTENWKLTRFAEELRDSLSEYVWAHTKRSRDLPLFSLEDALKEHFMKNDIKESDLRNNAYLRRLYLEANGKKS